MNSRCLVYLRYGERGPSREDQLADVTDFAQKNNLQIVNFFEDTGSLDELSALKRLMEQLRTGSANTLLTWRLDRLGAVSTSTLEVVGLISQLTKIGCRFISMCDRIDSDSTGGTFVTAISEAIKSSKLIIKGERVHTSLITAKNLGEPVGRPRIRNDLQIQELRKSGLSIRDIAQSLGTSTRSVSRALSTLDQRPDSPK